MPPPPINCPMTSASSPSRRHINWLIGRDGVSPSRYPNGIPSLSPRLAPCAYLGCRPNHFSTATRLHHLHQNSKRPLLTFLQPQSNSFSLTAQGKARFACFRRHQIHASIWTNIGPKHSSQNALRVADREKSSQR